MLRINGANTKMPQKPYMILGIAASISIKKLNGVLTDFGAISERNTATPMLTGSDIKSANKEEIIVP